MMLGHRGHGFCGRSNSRRESPRFLIEPGSGWWSVVNDQSRTLSMGVEGATLPPDAAGMGSAPDTHTLLTHSDFGSAVRDAFRHYVRTDLLAGNALLHAQLLTRSGPGA